MIDQKYIDRFWNKVDKTSTPNNCWTWTASRSKDGYGLFYFPGGGRAHRFSYIISKGPISKGLLVRHVCDNPSCVRPEHLELGTHKDNMQDKVSRNRSIKGTNNSNSKLNDNNIIEIRKLRNLGQTLQSLADQFNVSKPTIWHIVHHKKWTHI